MSLQELIRWEDIIPEGLPGGPPTDDSEEIEIEEDEEEWEDE